MPRVTAPDISLEVLFGPFWKCLIFPCKGCREILGHGGEVHEAIFVVVSVVTNGLNVVFDVAFISV